MRANMKKVLYTYLAYVNLNKVHRVFFHLFLHSDWQNVYS